MENAILQSDNLAEAVSSKWEVCQLLIEQEVKDALELDKEPAVIGRELSEFFKNNLKVEIAPRTIEQRARRIKEAATGVANPKKPAVKKNKNAATPVADPKKPAVKETKLSVVTAEKPQATEEKSQTNEEEKLTKPLSRPKRWSAACSDAKKSLDDLQVAIDELKEIQESYQEWLENIPENMAESPTAEKLNVLTEIDLEGLNTYLNDIENIIDECEEADLPLGYGRD